MEVRFFIVSFGRGGGGRGAERPYVGEWEQQEGREVEESVAWGGLHDAVGKRIWRWMLSRWGPAWPSGRVEGIQE